VFLVSILQTEAFFLSCVVKIVNNSYNE